MRKIIFPFLLILSSLALSQEKVDISSLFAKNAANSISNHFNSSIDLDLPDNKGVYSKNQAKLILQDFFKQNSELTYKSKHQGGGNNKAFFEIGSLSSSEKSYRTYFLYNLMDQNLQIIELRVQPEE